MVAKAHFARTTLGASLDPKVLSLRNHFVSVRLWMFCVCVVLFCIFYPPLGVEVPLLLTPSEGVPQPFHHHVPPDARFEWKHQKVAEASKSGRKHWKNRSKCSKYIFRKTIKTKTKKKQQQIPQKNDTNAKHPQMFTYKMVVVSAQEAKSGGRTKK